MLSLLADVRFTLRLFRRAPGFYATVLAVLVCGVGATTAMFSIAESLLLRPLPFPEPKELTVLESTEPESPHPRRPSVSVPDFLDWKAQATTFAQLAAVDHEGFSMASAGSTPESLSGTGVSGDFFPMLGIRPALGRLIGADDDRVGGAPVVVVSAALWHRRFASDPALVGRAVTLNGRPFTVIGVAAEGFEFSSVTSKRVDVWTPLAVTYAGYALMTPDERANRSLEVMGRRQHGVSLENAQKQLSAIAQNLEGAHPDTNSKVGVAVADMHASIVESARSSVFVLLGAVALVLAIVCANIANLLLARAQSRRGEMAIRSALGAAPSRLALQVVTETVVIFALGSVGGALLSTVLVDLFASGIDHNVTAAITIRVDLTALLASLAICLLCGAFAGLVPAHAVTRVEPHEILKENAARSGVSRGQASMRSVLVVAQVAVAFALLVGSGLALKAFAEVAATPPGFNPTNLVEGFVDLASVKYEKDEKVVTFLRDVLAKVREQPGVQAASANSTLPLGGGEDGGPFAIEGTTPWRVGEGPVLGRNSISPDYFRTMELPILRGREFTESDRVGGRLVAVISHATAERFFHGEDPIGRRIDWVEGQKARSWREIVGVVGDVRHGGLDIAVTPEAYIPVAQNPNRSMSLVVRTANPDALVESLPRIVQAVDPDQGVWRRQRMTDVVARSLGAQRHVASLLGAFAVAALVLSTLGVFGLVSYATAQRTREIGIRLAIGAMPEAVILLVMKSGLRLLGVGLLLGLPAALIVARIVASHVPRVSAFDPVVYTAITVLLSVASVAACLAPALRAVRTPPASAVRCD